MQTYLFKTQFLHAKKIQREIEVPENYTLYQLAQAILAAYGFAFDHPFGFFSNVTESWRIADSEHKYELFADMEDADLEPTGSGSVKKTKINQVWKQPKDQMLFLFDYGDEWRWIITLKGYGEKIPKEKYPRVLNAKGEAPKQHPDYEGK